MTDFTVTEVIYMGRETHILRCQTPQGSAILKRVVETATTPQIVARVRYEHKIILALQTNNAVNVIRTLGLTDTEGKLALMLEDTHAQSVGTIAPGKPWRLAEALHVGAEIARGLCDVHRAGYVHKDINPSNVIYNVDSGRVQLIDFGIASELPREHIANQSERLLEGTLHYMPPEQTGRIQRSVDWRSDLYALGATLYEMLTGKTPFDEGDTAALMYAVLTQKPRRADAVGAVPATVADIIAKLLAKAPEDRYQSARGVLHDLERCSKEFTQQHTIEPFTLGAADRTEHFAIAEKLYGRAEAMATLQAVYSKPPTQQATTLVVKGPSGIGKSSLVAELQPIITRDHGLFAVGKCEMLHGNQPFAVVSATLEMLFRRLLMEPEESLAAWQRRVQDATGSIGQALVDLVPAAHALLGPQKPIPPLGPQESENRLVFLLQRVFSAIARKQQLVVFLDDLQWSDSGTCKLLKRMATAENQGEHFVLVLAYRDNEVSGHHPLTGVLQALLEDTSQPPALTVAPLGVQDVTDLVADATGAPREQATQLATLLSGRTQGNPFLVRDAMQRLWEQRLLRFDDTAGHWTWDSAAVAASTVSAGAAELMLDRLRGLTPASQQGIGVAACLGAEFSLSDLCAICQVSAAAMQQSLNPCIQHGLILPLSNTYRYVQTIDVATDARFRFAHDKVQQAAYEQMPADDRATTHDKLAHLLARGRAVEELATDVFNIADHTNRAEALIRGRGQLQGMLDLNLRAGKEALRISALAPALIYLRKAANLLPEDAWQSQFETARDVNMALAEAEFVNGDIKAATQRVADVLPRMRTSVEKARILQRRGILYAVQGMFSEAIDDTCEALGLMHMPIPTHPSKLDLAREFVRLQLTLRKRDIVALGEQPFSRDPEFCEALYISENLGSAAINARPDLLGYMCMVSVRLVVERGLSAQSPHTYASMFPICALMGQYGKAHEWVKAVKRCMERVPNALQHGMVGFLILAYVEHTMVRPALLAARCEDVSQMLFEEGQPHPATWPLILLRMINSLTSIDESLASMDRYRDLERTFGHGDHNIQRYAAGEFALWAQDKQAEFFRDIAALDARAATSAYTNTILVWSYGLVARWLERDYEAARYWMLRCFSGDLYNNTDAILVHISFYTVMTCTRYAAAQGRKRVHDAKQFKRARKHLKALARGNADIFGGIPILIDAELAALQGRDAVAAQLYEQAVRGLAASGYPCFAEAAAECAARHAHKLGARTAAAAYLWRATQSTRQWGNKRKQRLLEEEFAEYFESGSLDSEMLANRATKTRTGHKTTGALTAEIDLPSIMRVTQAMTEELSIPKLGEQIISFVTLSAATTRTALALADHGKLQTLVDTAGAGAAAPWEIMALAVRSQQPVLINDVAKSSQYTDPYVRSGVAKALVCMPMLHRNQTVGVLVLEHRGITGAFTPQRLTLLNLFVPQAAAALVNAQTHGSLERMVQERTVQLQHAHQRILSIERESTEMQMAGGFAHEMRNALGAAGYAMMAMAGEDEEGLRFSALQQVKEVRTVAAHVVAAQPELGQTLHKISDDMEETETSRYDLSSAIQRGLARAQLITDEVLRYAQAGQLTAGDETTNVKSLVDKVLTDLKATLQSEQVSVQVPSDLQLPMKEEHAYVIVRNLVQNACDAIESSASGGPKTIQISGLVSTTGITVVSVEDTGPGVPDDMRERVFQAFFTTKGAHGTGLGLGMSRKLARIYGGDLRLAAAGPPQAAPRRGARFELVVPA